MKVLTAAQMREVDRLTIERGIPAEHLMERAGQRVFEVLESEFAPIEQQRAVVFCGQGNNGGDGQVLARLLRKRGVPVEVVTADGTAQATDHSATIVVDALLGTGFRTPVEGRYLGLIRSINQDFPAAKVVAVDLPSAMMVRADITVTFTAPKVEHYLAPESAQTVGRLIVAQIGSPAELVQSDLEVSEAHDFAPLFRPRKKDANKGNFGHVLVIGGAHGKTGAAAMSGLAALRMGAGLVTVASSGGTFVPELMTESLEDFRLERKTVIAVGPGLGPNRDLVEKLMKEAAVPMVIDADGLNSIAGTDFRGRGVQTILTPHPGEMTRLIGGKFTDRLATAREFAQKRNLCVVLKGYHTLIAFPDGRVWINPAGTPALAKGGTGDILTGLVAGMLAQFPSDLETAVRAAVWLHGRAGEIGAEELTEPCLIATDLLRFLPRAIRECV